MSTLFISDLHLDPSCPEIAEIFIHFLKKLTNEVSALYILGDLFEVWIGDDELTPFNSYIIQAIKEKTALGLPIYLLHGNRDFLIGKRFLKMTGCQLLPDESLINLYNVPTLLMHGDTLCTGDKAYIQFRKKVRNPIVQQLFLWKSLKKRQKIAQHYREKSKKHTLTASAEIMDVTPSEVEKKMKKHKTSILIHGHTHREGLHDFQINHQPVKRFVLGAWHDQGHALLCHPSGDKEFIQFK